MTLTTIRELDELPEGTTIELLDRRGSRLRKVGGHWRWAEKAPDSTWNMIAYVNVRRWGARVLTEEGVQVKLREEIEKIIKEYEEREEGREKELKKYQDEDGEVFDWYGYDSTRTDQDIADAEHYGVLINRLAGLIEK